MRITNDEILTMKEILNPNSKSDALVPDVIIRSFELRHSFDIRHSGFVIFQKVLALAPAKL